jgi:hypothetical protein
MLGIARCLLVLHGGCLLGNTRGDCFDHVAISTADTSTDNLRMQPAWRSHGLQQRLLPGWQQQAQ